MKIIYNVSSNTFKARDYNVDTIYIRYDEKYYKILDLETREKKEISKGEFDKLDVSEREVNYTEEQYTYKEYSQVLEQQVAKVNKDNTITQTALVDLEMKFLKEGLYE